MQIDCRTPCSFHALELCLHAGARWVTRFAGQWRSYVQADVGTGGSNLSWQAYGTLGYEFGWGTLFGGWRYLHVDYDQDAYRLNVALTGPFIGASFAFGGGR